jgi:DNA modification methylase
LNDLSGKEWIQYTKSWFVLHPSSRKEKKLHPASFPEELAQRFITFFTVKGSWVLDPFLGSGSTLLASSKLGRNGIGIELYEKYFKISEKRINLIDYSVKNYLFNTDSRNISKVFKTYCLPEVDLCLTSPPYWDQLHKENKRQKIRKDNNLDTKYGNDSSDLSSIKDYENFLMEQEKIFDQIYTITKNKGYLIIITNNIYKNKQMWPLAFDTYKSLSKKWIPKDEQIWCQNDKPLFPFGIFTTYVGNRCHHYCFIFQKNGLM